MKLKLPQRTCRRPGCGRLTSRGSYCQECAPIAQRARETQRGSAWRRGYDGDWASTRELFIRGSDQLGIAPHPWCEICLAAGLVIPTEEVHHKIPVSRRRDLRLDPTNLQALCKPCHSAITRAEQLR